MNDATISWRADHYLRWLADGSWICVSTLLNWLDDERRPRLPGRPSQLTRNMSQPSWTLMICWQLDNESISLFFRFFILRSAEFEDETGRRKSLFERPIGKDRRRPVYPIGLHKGWGGWKSQGGKSFCQSLLLLYFILSFFFFCSWCGWGCCSFYYLQVLSTNHNSSGHTGNGSKYVGADTGTCRLFLLFFFNHSDIWSIGGIDPGRVSIHTHPLQTPFKVVQATQ